MNNRHTKLIVTLGPATCTERDLRIIKDKGVDFVRVNMSHSSLQSMERLLALAQRVGIPFIIDTEGSQVRTGELAEPAVHFEDNDEVRLYAEEIIGNSKAVSLKPAHVVGQLEPGDLVYIDFDTVILRVMDVSTLSKGFIKAKAISGGGFGGNKAVVIDPVLKKSFRLPPLSPKDYQAIQLGLKAGVDHIAVSFVRSANSIREARAATCNRMKIISKVECTDALENIEEIVRESDYLLIDRGDLGKEIPIEKIPFAQTLIIAKARRCGTGVFVATNLLETMVEKKNPTRAEVQDVVNTLLDGAIGLTLAAETAIGKHPMECINMLNRIIQHTEDVLRNSKGEVRTSSWLKELESTDYLLRDVSSSLIPPHGGTLINRVLVDLPGDAYLESLPKVRLDESQQMDVEQIANGTYSPLDGFMGQEDFLSVLDEMRLVSGVVWPLPITLDVSEEVAKGVSIGDTISLSDRDGEVMALLHVKERYRFDREETAQKMYGTRSDDHPGVRLIRAMKPILLGGPIDLMKCRQSSMRAYEQTPRQVRRLLVARGWAKVLGFHTRNVIHRGHEFMQLKAMEEEKCDGLLLHPVIGKKKAGDFKPEFILKSYEKMIASVYPKDKVVLAAFSTFSRYAGPREALFTALCRKNYGCSHIIVGRDHTGVGKYYDPYASQRIFDRFPDLGIKIVKFNEIYYSRKVNDYVQEDGICADYGTDEKLRVLSGSEARAIFQKGEAPPSWFMRPEISAIVLEALRSGKQVFEEVD